MVLSTLFWRPVNLFRSQEMRANSAHTSNWGLARLSRKKASLSDAIEDNLASRIQSGNIPLKSLYRFDSFTVVSAILKSDLARVANLLSKAIEGDFPFTFISQGLRQTDYWACDHDGYRWVRSSEETYTEPMTKPYHHYNLTFFRGLRNQLDPSIWRGLVLRITEKNLSLGAVLTNIDAAIADAELALGAKYRLPTRVGDSGSY